MGTQENRMRIGNKKIFHLEAWVVKVMSMYKVRSDVIFFFIRKLSPECVAFRP